jgi:WD40 repeat protein
MAQLRFWNLEGELLKQRMAMKRADWEEFALSPDGELMATAGADHTIKLWSIEG